MVNTWLVPVGLVAVAGVMLMFAFTHTLLASALSPARPSPDWRWRETPRTVTSVAARTTVVPVAFEVIATVHDPVAATVLQEFTPPTKLPGPLWIEKLIVVPAGAVTDS